MKTKDKIVITSIVLVLVSLALLLSAYFINKADRERYYYEKIMPDGSSLSVFALVGDEYVDVSQDVMKEKGLELENGFVYKLVITSDDNAVVEKTVDLKTKENGLYGAVKNFGFLNTIWVLIALVVTVGLLSYSTKYCISKIRKHLLNKRKEIGLKGKEK